MKVRRTIHIAITLLAVVTLIRPFDCLAGAFSPKAAACCAKGQCTPSAGADECCKTAIPPAIQVAASKAPDDWISWHVMPASTVSAVTVAPPGFFAYDEAHAPPRLPPHSRLNMPLLI